MNMFKKVILTTLATGTLAATGCKKSDVIEQPKIDKTLTFSLSNADAIAEPYTAVKQYNSDENVGNIYLKPEDSFGGANFGLYRTAIENTMAQSPKVKAAPDAEFTTLGAPFITDENRFKKTDSLWFVSKGFKFQKTL